MLGALLFVLAASAVALRAHAAPYLFTTLDVAGAEHTFGYSINDRGQIVGSYTGSTGVHGFIWEKGMATTVDVPGAVFTTTTGINNHGQIVGSYVDGSNNTHGYIAAGSVDNLVLSMR